MWRVTNTHTVINPGKEVLVPPLTFEVLERSIEPAPEIETTQTAVHTLCSAGSETSNEHSKEQDEDVQGKEKHQELSLGKGDEQPLATDALNKCSVKQDADQMGFGTAPEEHSTSEDAILTLHKMQEQEDTLETDEHGRIEAEECQNVEKIFGLVADQECFGTAPEEHSTSEDAILTLHTVHEQEDTEEQNPQEIGEHARKEAEECQNVEKTPGFAAGQESFGTAPEKHSMSEDAILTLHKVQEKKDTEEQDPQEIDEHAKDQEEAEECQNVEKTPGFAAGQESFGTAPEDHYFMSEDAILTLHKVHKQKDTEEQDPQEIDEHGKDQEEAEECQNVEKTPGLVADQECFGTAREEHSTSEDAILTLHTVHEQEDTEEQVPQEIDEHAKDQQEAEECQNVEKTPGFAAGQESFGTAPEDHYFMSEDANNLKLDEVREQDDMTEQETEERGDKEDDESQRSMSHDASFTDRGVDTKQDVQGQGKGNEELVGKGAEEALPADEIHFTSSGATMDGENVVEQVEEARPSAHGPFEPFSIKLQEARLDAAMHPECAYQKGRLYEQAQQLFPTKSPGGLAKKSPTTNRAAQRVQREQATAVPTRGSSEVISSKHPRSKISIAATPAPAPKPQPKARPADEQAKQAQAAARKRIAAHRKTLADADKTADPSSISAREASLGGLTSRSPVPNREKEHITLDCARERLCGVGDLDLEAAPSTHHLTHPAALNSSKQSI